MCAIKPMSDYHTEEMGKDYHVATKDRKAIGTSA